MLRRGGAGSTIRESIGHNLFRLLHPMPLARKRIFRIPPPPPTTIYVRPGYNRVLAEEFAALKVKRVGFAIGAALSRALGGTLR